MSLNHTSQYSELTDKHFQAIGKIVVEMSNIDFLTKLILNRLLLTPNFLGRTYTSLMTCEDTETVLLKALTLHTKRYENKIIEIETSNSIKTLINKIRDIRGNRNRISHFCWARMSDDQIFGTCFSDDLPSSKKYKKNNIIFTVTELNKIYEDAYEIVKGLEKILDNIPEIQEETILSILKK